MNTCTSSYQNHSKSTFRPASNPMTTQPSELLVSHDASSANPPVVVNHPGTLASLTRAFGQYEQALVHNTVEVLDALFWDSPHTLRFGAGENLWGSAQIRAFRAARPAVGLAREVLSQHIVTFGQLDVGNPSGVANITFSRAGQTRIGRQTQSWVYFGSAGWRVVAAHVSWMEA